MNISPQRRQRILQAHQLRQQGRTLSGIGKTLGVSHATIVADLKLLESQWSDVAEQSADDTLLEQLQLLQSRLRTILPVNVVKTYGQCTPADFARIYEAHVAEVATLLRETRRTAAALHDRAQLRRAGSDESDQELSFPSEELAGAHRPAKRKQPRPAQPPQSPEPGLPALTKPDHPNHAIPSPALEIGNVTPQEKTSDQPPEHDPVLAEARAILKQIQDQTIPHPERNGAAA